MSYRAAFLVALFALLVFAREGRSGAPDKPAKNVQILTGLSKSELTQVMNFMRASLGVHCDFCHTVGKDGWKWENDEKPQKKRAREMMRMVMEINRANFKGASAVSCFTCHQGGQRPNPIPPLPQKDPSFPTVIPESQISDIPAQQILDRYREATGGQARTAITNASTLVMKGTTDETWKHKYVRYEVYHKAPDKWLTKKFLDQGTFTEGWNGVKGWTQNDTELSEMSAEEADYFRQSIESLRLYPELPASTVPLVRKIKIDDRDAYSLEYSIKAGVSEKYCFDAQSNLLIRRLRHTSSVIGIVPEEILYSDYKKVEGASIPFIIRSNLVDPWSSGTRSFTRILVNEPLEDSLFEMPSENR